MKKQEKGTTKMASTTSDQSTVIASASAPQLIASTPSRAQDGTKNSNLTDDECLFKTPNTVPNSAKTCSISISSSSSEQQYSSSNTGSITTSHSNPSLSSSSSKSTSNKTQSSQTSNVCSSQSLTTVTPGTSTPNSVNNQHHYHSNNNPGSMGMKHSKSDHSGLSGRKEKHKDGKSAMGNKKFISKSQENLSSQKKKQLSAVTDSPRPRPNVASQARAEMAMERNKENMALKEREKNGNAVFAKPRPVKQNSGNSSGGNCLRKASSTQSIDKSSQGSNSLKSNSSSTSSKSSSNLNIKRAQSTQNICKDKSMKKRTSAPADVMAYNAELLANFEKEKKVLENRISELTKVAEGRKGEIEKYKYEVRRLKDQVSASATSKEEIEILRSENKQLSDRLQELGFPAEQVTDTEKLMLKLSLTAAGASGGVAGCGAKSQGSSSDINLPTSASCDSLSTDGHLGRGESYQLTLTAGTDPSRTDLVDLRRSNSLCASETGLSLPDLCATPDHPSVLSLDTANWEKQSNKSANSDGGLSEVSVACLTERILQMEETNYSTTEELQATLQELGDLQDAVNELTEENGRLVDEKTVLLESLCTQTEKLENTRIQLEQLKCLLISGELPDKSERDGHLLGLLKSAQEEREELMRKQHEWSNALQGLESECKEAQEAGENLRERYSFLEESNAAMKEEREVIDKLVQDLKEQHETEKIEVVRLKKLLENERGKVAELENTRKAMDRTDLEELLDSTRTEKAKAEERVTDLTESLARYQCDVLRLKESLSTKEQELIISQTNASQQAQELQFKLDEGEKEKVDVLEEASSLRAHVEQLEQDCDKHVEEKKNLSAKLHEIQSEMRQTIQQKLVAEQELQEISCKHDTESEEWRQFQKDLQMAVVIANNFSQETQESMEQLSTDNSQLQEQVVSLKAEVEKLKADLKSAKELAEEQQQQQQFPTRKSSIMTNAELKGKVGKVLNTMDRDLAVLREARSPLDQRSQSISVKSLIRSIEEQVKSGCSSIHSSSRSESRRSSTSSDMSLTSLKELVKSPTSPLPTPDSPRSPSKDFSIRSSSLRAKPGERSPQQRLTHAVTPTSLSTPGGCSVGGPVAISASETPVKGFTPTRVDVVGDGGSGVKVSHPISSILKDRSTPRRNSGALDVDVNKKDTPSRDPLASLAKVMKGSKRNALLKWCQLKTIPYSNVDITNFSSSWNDGLGFCALLHSYVPDKIPYPELTVEDKRKNFNLAFKTGESIGIKSNLNINDMVCMERPDWQAVMGYVTSIYRHFEVDKQ